MRAYDAGRWLLLATLWSLQFLFLRVAVPVFGTAPVAEGRALFAAAFLLPWVVLFARQRVALFAHWKDHLAVGLVNNVLPFVCFAFAAAVLPASYLAIINGLVPLWAAVIAAPVLGEPFGLRRAAGFALGIAGVALIVNLGPVALDAITLLGSVAAIAGTALWGWAGVMIKQRTGRMPPMGLAAGSIVFAAVIMAPLWTLTPAPAAWTLEAFGAMVAVGILCSGLAYLPFFTLIRDIGPSRTLAVGLAVPVLGVAWGWLLLDEAVTAPMLLGAALVLAALALVLRK
ncbi:MAG TPA: DMT family transporter [Burkholderiales bacterium]|nr:DMT family transporter [Burkholderiales bacterium]